LWEIVDGEAVRFRCRVGHGYGPESLLAEQGKGVEAALWAAARALEERAALSRRLATRARQRRHLHTAVSFDRRAAQAEQRAELVRGVLRGGETVEAGGGDTPPAGGSGT
jgi:two-component system chemotaxis response regulator CheB